MDEEDQKETGRVEAFSDGVFGIAITLLVLNIRVPKLSELTANATLLDALLRQWPEYVSYSTSFLTVLIMWINHHRMFRHIHYVDHFFLILNGLLLMFVTLVPFPTALVAEHSSGPEARTAALVYSGSFIVIAVLFVAVWRYASREERLLAPNHQVHEVRAISRQYRFGPLLYVAAFLLAFLNAKLSVGACLALALYFALPGGHKA